MRGCKYKKSLAGLAIIAISSRSSSFSCVYIDNQPFEGLAISDS
jgi:hypothetical protein